MELVPGCCLFLKKDKKIKATTVSKIPGLSVLSQAHYPPSCSWNWWLPKVTALNRYAWVCPSPFNPIVQSCLRHSPPSGGCSASSHHPEECVDVVALDGVSTGRDHLVLGLPHWEEGGNSDTRMNKMSIPRATTHKAMAESKKVMYTYNEKRLYGEGPGVLCPTVHFMKSLKLATNTMFTMSGDAHEVSLCSSIHLVYSRDMLEQRGACRVSSPEHSPLFLAHWFTNFSAFQHYLNFSDQINYGGVTALIHRKYNMHYGTVAVGSRLPSLANNCQLLW